jgi:hypothetical protein
MKLVNTQTLKAIEFSDESLPPYAVVSQTWNPNNVWLTNYSYLSETIAKAERRTSQLSNLAKRQGHDWIWLDTCCRSSSANEELLDLKRKWTNSLLEAFVFVGDVPWLPKGNNTLVVACRKVRWSIGGAPVLTPCKAFLLDAQGRTTGTATPKSAILDDDQRCCFIAGLPQAFLGIQTPAKANMDAHIQWDPGQLNTVSELASQYDPGHLGISVCSDFFSACCTLFPPSEENTRHGGYASGMDDGMANTNRLRRRELESASNRSSPQLRQMTPKASLRDSGRSTPLAVLGPSPSPIQQETSQRFQFSALNLVEEVDTVLPSAPRFAIVVPVCWVIIILGSLDLCASLAIGLYYSIARDKMSDGFTLASWMLAAGTFVLAGPVALHYRRCRCWERANDERDHEA